MVAQRAQRGLRRNQSWTSRAKAQRAPSKFEARNSKLETISNDKTPQFPNNLDSGLEFRILIFRILKIVSDFDIRIWNLRKQFGARVISRFRSCGPSENLRKLWKLSTIV